MEEKNALDIAWILKHVDHDASGVADVEYSRKRSFIAFSEKN